MFTYAYVKWFYGQSERAYYLNNFIIKIVPCLWRTKFANFNQSTYKKRFFEICFCLETTYWDIHLILWIRKIFVDKNWCLNNILSKGSFSTGYSLSFKSLSVEEVSNAKNNKKNRTKKKLEIIDAKVKSVSEPNWTWKLRFLNWEAENKFSNKYLLYPFNTQEWLVSNISWQFHPWIRH